MNYSEGRLKSLDCHEMTAVSPSLCTDAWPIGMRMTKFSFLFKCLTLAALGVILVMSLRPSVSVGGVQHMDKVLHLGAYAVLSGLARLGWPKLWGGLIFIGLAVFGIGIEIAQHTMNLGRTGSLADIAANLTGAALPLIVFHFFWTRHQR